MKHCAVAFTTESGDLYSYLVQYIQTSEVPKRIYEWMGEEAAYICEVEVDSGVDAELDDEIETQIYNFINVIQQGK